MVNRLSSAPVTNTTSAPRRRTPSARSAQSASTASTSSGVSSPVNGENHTSSPSSAADRAAASSRSGWPPVSRTAVQCNSSRMTRRSRATTSRSHGSCVVSPYLLMKPVS